MRIGAIDTAKGAAPFGLQTEHPTIPEIKIHMGGIRMEFTHRRAGPGAGKLRRGAGGDHAGDLRRFPAVVNGIHQHSKPLPLTDDAVIHSQGRKYLPAQLLQRELGEPVNVEPFLNYIKGKYSRIYGF